MFLGVGCAQTVEDTVANNAPSVFKLNEGEEATCTTFYVGDNLFVTAYHCVDSKDKKMELSIEMGDMVVIAELAAYSVNHDIAILMAPNMSNALPLQLWKGAPPAAGRQIVSMGYPGYLAENFAIEVGYIVVPQATFSKPTERTYMISKNMTFFGESGGPIFDVKTGRVVAMSDKLRSEVEPAPSGGHIHNYVSLSTIYFEVQDILDYVKANLAITEIDPTSDLE